MFNKFDGKYFEGMILKETSKQKIEESPLAKLAKEEWEAMTEEEKKNAIKNADKSPFL